MLPAIDLDYEFPFDAGEIEDIAAERMLAAEFASTDLSLTQR